MFWSISQSIPDGFVRNLHKVGVTSRDNQNEGQQPHVSTKTAMEMEIPQTTTNHDMNHHK